MKVNHGFLVASIVSLAFLAFNDAYAESVADKIQFAGHGMLFDKDFKQIVLDATAINDSQDAMLTVLKEHNSSNKAALRALRKTENLISRPTTSADDRVVMKAGMIERLLKHSSESLRLQYGWRNDIILSRHLERVQHKHDPQDSASRAKLMNEFGLLRKFARDAQSYQRDCRAQQVPIPPDWAESGTAWALQGNLKNGTNLLAPGDDAFVWTYSDPSARGACIVLPRGSGVAGIICQSATTGHACFWDNIQRSTGNRIDWKEGTRLVISELQDGSNLGENCTGCHRGNNVFLISPDDPTWTKLLRGTLSGPHAGNFTTRVEASSDTQGGGPRYRPITTNPPRPGWANTFSPESGCYTGCHEKPVVRTPNPMPPNCGTNCYAAPIPPHDQPIACTVWEDNLPQKSHSEAIYFADSRTACVPDGTARGSCGRWFGRCLSTNDNVPVNFRVFNDGDSNATRLADGIYSPGPNTACVADGTGRGDCRRWLGMPTTADGRKAECYLFDDGLSNWIGPTHAIYYRGPGQVCMPDGTATGACRKWFGNCQVTNQQAPLDLNVMVNPSFVAANRPQTFTVNVQNALSGATVTDGEVFVNGARVGRVNELLTATFPATQLPRRCHWVPGECDDTIPRRCTKPHKECEPAEWVVDPYTVRVRNAPGYFDANVPLTVTTPP